MLNLSFRRLRARFTLLAVVALSALLLCSVAFAQTSVLGPEGVSRWVSRLLMTYLLL
jgi:hypothetical protein